MAVANEATVRKHGGQRVAEGACLDGSSLDAEVKCVIGFEVPVPSIELDTSHRLSFECPRACHSP